MTRDEAKILAEKCVDEILEANEGYYKTESDVDLIDKIYDDFERKFDFVEQYKFTDKCPGYKTKEQFKMFISSRETDIKNIKLAIKEAKQKIKNFEDKYA